MFSFLTLTPYLKGENFKFKPIVESDRKYLIKLILMEIIEVILACFCFLFSGISKQKHFKCIKYNCINNENYMYIYTHMPNTNNNLGLVIKYLALIFKVFSMTIHQIQTVF